MFHSNATGAPIANPPNSAQLGGSLYHAPKLIRVRAVVWAYGRGQTDRHTDARDHNTFCVVADDAKCIVDMRVCVCVCTQPYAHTTARTRM